MRKIAVIPARLAATRFPGKLLQQIGEKSIISLVYENAMATGLFDMVLVATDSEEIAMEIRKIQGNVFMSQQIHQSGSDRIAEAVATLDVDVIVNIQGDEPFVKKEPLADLLACFEEEEVCVASLMKAFGEGDEPGSPNQVKVVCDKRGNALYFSRSMIPFRRNLETSIPFYRHIGVYAFRKEALLSFTQWEQGILEQTEMLEQLRYLENGISIRMVETKTNSIGIDTPEDLERARDYYRKSSAS